MLFLHNGRIVNYHKDYPIKCQSCAWQCNMTDTFNVRMLNCMESQYNIWPIGNFLLEKGITLLLKDNYYNIHSGGMIFVDFSHYYLSLFADDAWLNHLKKVPMKIILLSDQTMEPLAGYWKHKETCIVDVLTVRTYKPLALRKSGRMVSMNQSQKITRATGLEVKILHLLLSGYSTQEVAEIVRISNKSVFNLKYSLERKMGKKLKELIIL
ncbi:HTH luxR-type domain-containing protein [Citrobacter sedlakii]